MGKKSKSDRPERGVPLDFLGQPLTAERIRAQYRFYSDQEEKAYREVRSSKVPGHIGHDSVTMQEGPSSITYRNGCVTYGF